jgi:DNA polymerase II small subunit/DNA polymerase delta subunit B
MVKPLSEQLSDLSVRAKNAEDAVAAAQKEAHEKVVARREQSRAAVSAAIDKVDKDIKSAGDTTAGHWEAFKAKINSDMEGLKQKIAEKRHERDVRHAQGHADRLEMEAACSVDYAIASIEQAKLAVLDAMVGRVEAERAKNL